MVFNQNNNTQSFTDGAGNFSTLVWQSTSPYGSGDYDDKGQIRFKVVKTGTTMSIYNTSKMGTGSGQLPIGSTNPYTLLVSIDLADDNTWTDKPSYAVGTELLRFTGGTQFGYLTASQQQTQFYDIVFSGSQQTNNDSLYAVGLTTPGANNVSTFNEVGGCWDYVGEVTGYTGPTYSLTIDNGYVNCTQCPTDDTPLPSSTPLSSSAPTPTPTPTPTQTPIIPPTPTPTPTPQPSGPHQIWVSGPVGPSSCSTFCSINYNVSLELTCDGIDATQPTHIFGIQNGIEGGHYAYYWIGASNTGTGNTGVFRIAQCSTENDPSSPNYGLFGKCDGSLYECGAGSQCVPI